MTYELSIVLPYFVIHWSILFFLRLFSSQKSGVISINLGIQLLYSLPFLCLLIYDFIQENSTTWLSIYWLVCITIHSLVNFLQAVFRLLLIFVNYWNSH